MICDYQIGLLPNISKNNKQSKFIHKQLMLLLIEKHSKT